jgi:hypothetical protein
MTDERLQRVLAAIDALNAEDPNRVTIEGIPRPHELTYAQRITDWVLRLRPDAPDTLRIAARGQHVRRWTIPRTRYAPGRQGYLRWRETLKRFHAEQVGQVMQQAGYAGEAIGRVQAIMSKRQLGSDAETQTLEDALCLVFLETQFGPMRRKTQEATMAEVVRKTWRKMSTQARQAALTLPLPADDQAWLARAVSLPSSKPHCDEGETQLE